jgi:hypothetical protein
MAAVRRKTLNLAIPDISDNAITVTVDADSVGYASYTAKKGSRAVACDPGTPAPGIGSK